MKSIADVSNKKIAHYVRKLEIFLGPQNVQRRIKRFQTSFNSSSQAMQYYIVGLHPWWPAFIEYNALQKSGKSIWKIADASIKTLAFDGMKISHLQRYMPADIRDKYRRDLLEDGRAFDYLFEIQMAWHFYVRGCKIFWTQQASSPRHEFYVKDKQFSFNVECKRISLDTARKIRRKTSARQKCCNVLKPVLN